MLPRAQLLQHIQSLGREFARRGMRQHLQRLRVYYLAVKNGLVSPSNELEVKWTEPFVIDWLKILQVSPFERTYPVRPRGSRCLRCPESPQGAPSLFTEKNFPGGSQMRCQRCGALWLERD